MNVENAFEQLLGRRASNEERARLHRVRDVLGLADNDALWLIVLALEHYDAIFRAYPERIANVTREVLDRMHDTCTTGAAAAPPASHETSRRSFGHPPRMRADAFRWSGVSVALALAIAFGALCMTAGYDLAGRARPFWAGRNEALEGFAWIAAVTVAAPAGWMVFALLIPFAAYCGTEAWATVRDPDARPMQRGLAWATLVTMTVGGVAAVVVLGQVI